MSYQLAEWPTSLLRASHVALNPVSGLYEPFILLESQHVMNQLGGKDSLAGGANPLYALTRMDLVSTSITAPDGSATAIRLGANGSANHGASMTNINNGYVQGGLRGHSIFLKSGTITQAKVYYFGDARIYQFDLANVVPLSGNTDTKWRIRPAAGDNPAQAGWVELYSVNFDNQNVSAQNLQVDMIKGGTTNFTGAASDGDYFDMWVGYVENAAAYSQFMPAYPIPSFPAGNAADNGSDFAVLPLGNLAAPQPMTIYLEFLDRGNGLKATPPGVFSIGSGTGVGDGVQVTQTPTGFSGTLTLGGHTSVSTVALAPAIGDLVSLRAVIDSAGSLTLFASNNGAAEIAGSTGSAVTLTGAWADSLFIMNGIGNTLTGDMALRKAKAFHGVIAKAYAQLN